MLSWLVGKPMPVRPLPVSKVNTVAQIVFATLVLAETRHSALTRALAVVGRDRLWW